MRQASPDVDARAFHLNLWCYAPLPFAYSSLAFLEKASLIGVDWHGMVFNVACSRY